MNQINQKLNRILVFGCYNFNQRSKYKGGETGMLRSKKFIIVALLAAVVMVGSTAGVVLAQTGDEDNSSQTQQGALLVKVCEIYEENTGTAIDAQALKEAFVQAQDEVRTEVLDSHLQKLVEEGKITQEQADQYKDWLESRPDVPVALEMPGAGIHRSFDGSRGFGPPSLPDGFEMPSPPDGFEPPE
jgi:hypothetical protein